MNSHLEDLFLGIHVLNNSFIPGNEGIVSTFTQNNDKKLIRHKHDQKLREKRVLMTKFICKFNTMLFYKC